MLGRERRKLVEAIKRKRKLVFLRNVWWKFAKFRNDPKWRKPRGKDNPMRLKLKGHPPVASVGYRVPVKIRGLHPSGLKPVVIYSIDELHRYDPKDVIIYLSSTIGLKKRLEIVNKARELGFVVANTVV